MSGTKSKTTSDSAASDGGSRSTDERDVHHSPPSSSTSTFISSSSQQNNSSSTLSFTMPIKQDPSDQYWSILSYNPEVYNANLPKPGDNNVPPLSSSSSMFQQPESTMFPAITELGSSGSGMTEGGMYVQQQQQYVTPMAFAKASFFQTPIFGME